MPRTALFCSRVFFALKAQGAGFLHFHDASGGGGTFSCGCEKNGSVFGRFSGFCFIGRSLLFLSICFSSF